VQARYDISYVQCMSAKGENVPNIAAYPGPTYYYGSPYSPYGYYPYSPYYYPSVFIGGRFGGGHFHHFRGGGRHR
jgi:hypothetical protein